MNRLAQMVLKNILRLPGVYGKLRHYAKHVEDYPEEERFAYIRYILTLAVKAGRVEIRAFGQEHIPESGGVLFYGNHQGMFDVMAFALTCVRPIGAVFKKELEGYPVVKEVAACTGSFAMDRDNVRQSMTVIRNVTEEVVKGRCYMIYPEGTRSKKGNEMGEFHAGSFRCAVKSGCPVVPVAVVDSFRVLDQKGSAPISMEIHYLPAISSEEYRDMKTGELAELVKSRIAEKLAERTGA